MDMTIALAIYMSLKTDECSYKTTMSLNTFKKKNPNISFSLANMNVTL